MVVFKYRIEPIEEPTIQLPRGARFLHVGEQDDELYVWALVDSSQPWHTLELVVIGTGWGHKSTNIGPHIGTVQMRNGLVFHVFYREAQS